MTGVARETGTGIELRVRLTPRAAHDRIDGPAAASDGSRHIGARVRAVPEKGRANAALVQLIARWLDVAPGAVVVVGGATGRLKTLAVSGDPRELMARVDLLVTA
ncbi:MAG: DUF167 family protein [Mesorhizobium sp.]